MLSQYQPLVSSSPESNTTTAATAATPGISGEGASSSSPLNFGDVGSGTSGQQVGATIFHGSLAIVCLEGLKNTVF